METAKYQKIAMDFSYQGSAAYYVTWDSSQTVVVIKLRRTSALLPHGAQHHAAVSREGLRRYKQAESRKSDD